MTRTYPSTTDRSEVPRKRHQPFVCCTDRVVDMAQRPGRCGTPYGTARYKNAAARLIEIVRSGQDSENVYEQAAVATGDLRLLLAAAYEWPKLESQEAIRTGSNQTTSLCRNELAATDIRWFSYVIRVRKSAPEGIRSTSPGADRTRTSGVSPVPLPLFEAPLGPQGRTVRSRSSAPRRAKRRSRS